MTQRTLNNGDTGLDFRTKLNDNFTDAAFIDESNIFTAAQVWATQVATLNGAQTLDFSLYNNFIITLDGNITLSNPTTEVVGQSGFICFKQDATGSRTLTLGSEFLNAGGAAPTLTTTASGIDVLSYCVVGTGQILLGAPLLEFS